MNANIRAVEISIFHTIEMYERTEVKNEFMEEISKEFRDLFKEFKNIPEECEFRDKCGESYAESHGLTDLESYEPMRDESRD